MATYIVILLIYDTLYICNLTFQIKNSKVDIFCLQEIFFSDIQRQIVAAVKDEFPYAFSAQNLSMQPIPSIPTMACTVAQLRTYQECIVQRCSSFQGPVFLCIALRYIGITIVSVYT